MIPNTTLQHYVNSSSKNSMDMSSLLLNALYERTLQERLMAQEVPSHQQHSVMYLPSNTVINHGNLPASVSLDGKLYALLPIQDQSTSGSVENHQSQLLRRRNMVEQYRDDSNSGSRGNETTTTPVVPSNVANTRTSRRKGKDTQGTKHRPTIHVPPMAFFSIREPCVNDVLMGRGGRINKHAGNVQLRNIVAARQDEYLSSSTGKLDKAHIAADIVASIRLQYHPPGRFLEQNPVDHTWYEVGDERAIRKVLQALREHAPEFRSSTAMPSSTTSSTIARQTEV
jgi:hypothetical protein